MHKRVIREAKKKGDNDWHVFEANDKQKLCGS